VSVAWPKRPGLRGQTHVLEAVEAAGAVMTMSQKSMLRNGMLCKRWAETVVWCGQMSGSGVIRIGGGQGVQFPWERGCVATDSKVCRESAVKRERSELGRKVRKRWEEGAEGKWWSDEVASLEDRLAQGSKPQRTYVTTVQQHDTIL
jgi:hypothetical protein